MEKNQCWGSASKNMRGTPRIRMFFWPLGSRSISQRYGFGIRILPFSLKGAERTEKKLIQIRNKMSRIPNKYRITLTEKYTTIFNYIEIDSTGSKELEVVRRQSCTVHSAGGVSVRNVR
jgi:hypothetical protein